MKTAGIFSGLTAFDSKINCSLVCTDVTRTVLKVFPRSDFIFSMSSITFRIPSYFPFRKLASSPKRRPRNLPCFPWHPGAEKSRFLSFRDISEPGHSVLLFFRKTCSRLRAKKPSPPRESMPSHGEEPRIFPRKSVSHNGSRQRRQFLPRRFQCRRRRRIPPPHPDKFPKKYSPRASF